MEREALAKTKFVAKCGTEIYTATLELVPSGCNPYGNKHALIFKVYQGGAEVRGDGYDARYDKRFNTVETFKENALDFVSCQFRDDFVITRIDDAGRMAEYEPNKTIEQEVFSVSLCGGVCETYAFESRFTSGFNPETNNTCVSVSKIKAKDGSYPGTGRKIINEHEHVAYINTERTKGVLESFRDWCFDWLFGHVPVGSVIEDRGCLFKVG